ncbi:MAG: CPBP family intramembrane glutamic endopeptidase [Pseudobacter sp.]|uniref:CPBP family intramembrane glutamic endopeptidase n=1 Tax=Pseudobacter sp. TaxID=2045420 RepID=UPI003F7D18DD
MKAIIGYLQQYVRSLNKLSALGITLLTTFLIILNYTVGIEQRCMGIDHYGLRFLAFFGVFTFVYGAAWLIQYAAHRKTFTPSPFFWFLVLAAPAIFAGKVSFDWITRLFTSQLPFPWHQYGYLVLNWPLKCLLVLGFITLIWKWGKYKEPVAGMSIKGFDAKPYFILLLMMVPLIVFASTQADFLRTYPKVHRIDFIEPFVQQTWTYKLIYEISYGIDFLTIETFFRGFLILAFARYAGKHAILPMAAFYCAIHFGKPLLECITSYFGGMILGVVVYQTKSIWGGLIVHLGIAWLMEAGGAIGHAYMK